MSATIIEKVSALQSCLADLEQRSAGSRRGGIQIDGVRVTCINERPIINLREPPPGFEGVVVVSSPGLKIKSIEHLGCQLRWPMRVVS